MTVASEEDRTGSPFGTMPDVRGAAGRTRAAVRLVRVGSAVVAGLYAALAVAAHQRYRTGMDLAIFSQAARHLADGELPRSAIKGPDYVLFGDHLHPVILVLGIPWRLWHDPRSLLVAQAVCIGLALAIVGSAVVVRAGPRAGVVTWGALSLSAGTQGAALFDVHEIAIGAPLVALAAADLLLGRVRRCVLWTALLPLVKEDMGVLMLGIALVLLVRGHRRLAAALGAWSVVSLVLAVEVVIPAINPSGVYPYDGQISTHPRYLLTSLVTDGTGTITLITLCVGAGVLALRSPLVLAAAAPLALRMISSNPSHWGLGYHYSLLPALLLAVAAADGLARTSARRWRVVSLGAAAAVTAWVIVTGPLGSLVSSLREPCARCEAATAAITQVPTGAAVAADDVLTPHLVADRTVSHISPNYWAEDDRRPAWMVLDRETRAGRHAEGRPWVSEHIERALEEDYEIVWERDGYVVLHRR